MGEGIAGYAYGTAEAARSPLSMQDLEHLEQTVLFSEDDERALRMAGDVLEDQVDDVLEVWYGFVASHPHLVHYFSGAESGEPIGEYLERVRERFGSSTPAGGRTTRSGSTTRRRSRSGTRARRRTGPTG